MFTNIIGHKQSTYALFWTNILKYIIQYFLCLLLTLFKILSVE